MLTDAQRSMYYEARRLSPAVIREVEEMRTSSPSREVGQRGLKNILVDMSSPTNGSMRKLESATCEFVYALELDTFDACHEYYTQVAPKNVMRYGRTSSAHVDFLVFRRDAIELVECKPRSSLERLRAKKPDEWVYESGAWRRPPLQAWASDRGLIYTVWSPPEPHGIYGANLLVIHAAKRGVRDLTEAPCVARLCKRLQSTPLSLRQALTEIRGLSGAHVLTALADDQLYGPLTSVTVDQVDSFMLFADKERALECDARLLRSLRTDMAELQVTSKLLTATSVDYAGAQRRLARINRILAGEEPMTRRYSRLVQIVSEARQAGDSDLEVCLTQYVNSGRRAGQLTSEQEEALSEAIARYRRDPLVRTKVQAHDLLVLACQRRGIRPPSRATFETRLRRKGPLIRAYAEGGHRAYHAAEPAMDPKDRTLRCCVPGVMVHVDATKFDVRCSPDVLAKLGFDCPTLYVAMDSATSRPLGYSVLFGAACRRALAVLIRDVLHRQGFLPRYWIADGGAEYTGAWFNEFCAFTGATRLQPPPGAPRKNSMAENALGRVNAELAHRFLGSTAPDKAGRSVTARQKSYATACHTYATIVGELQRYLFEDVPATPLASIRTSPDEQWEELTELFGSAGVIRIEANDEFLIATSIPVERDVTIDPVRGIRYLGRKYVSHELMQLSRGVRPAEIRNDSVDPHRLYVKLHTAWVVARTAQSLALASRSVAAKLVEGMLDGARRSEAAALRADRRQQRTLRIEEANQAAGSTAHLQAMLDKQDPVHPPVEEGWGRWSDPMSSIDAFDVEEAR